MLAKRQHKVTFPSIYQKIYQILYAICPNTLESCNKMKKKILFLQLVIQPYNIKHSDDLNNQNDLLINFLHLIVPTQMFVIPSLKSYIIIMYVKQPQFQRLTYSQKSWSTIQKELIHRSLHVLEKTSHPFGSLLHHAFYFMFIVTSFILE